jgi:mono/diheme cytochrome c family protein
MLGAGGRPPFRAPRLAAFAVMLGVFLQTGVAVGWAQSADQVDDIRRTVVAAGERYRSGKVDEAVTMLNEANQRLQQLATQVTNAKELKALQTLHGGLAKAYEKLELEGILLEPLPAWEQLVERQAKPAAASQATGPAGSRPGQGVDFIADIAPWLVSKCGRCHIDESKGGFSLATMEALAKGSRGGSVILVRDADHSRLVEVIESGDMPRGGGKVTPQELAKLKDWINQGANFDRARATVSLQSLAVLPTNAQARASGREAMAAEIRKPTGKESVSFAREIAPLLIEQCSGCHYDARQLRGELNMNSFAQLWKGGESGAMIKAGEPEESLLVRKLRGTAGDRMPAGGRPPLNGEAMEKVVRWIAEGASFDGHSVDARLNNVVDQAWAASASSAEMMARRRQRALDHWKVAFSKVEPVQAADDEFVVIGDIGQAGVEEVLAQTRIAYDKVCKGLKVPARKDLLGKGGVTIFALKNRYDYGEFGKMNESRTLPSQWSSHWRRELLDVYVVLLYDAKDDKQNQASLIQQLGSLWVSSHQGTPAWFADGFGRGVLAMIGGRSEAKIKSWDQQLPTIVQGLENPKELIDGQMNEEEAAILGYALVRKMIDSPGRKAFENFVRAIDKSQDFEAAFRQAIGPLDTAIALTFRLSTKTGPSKKGKGD